MATNYTVEARWDADARVYWAVCADIPGFVTEAATFDALVMRAMELITELVDTTEGATMQVVMPEPRTERLPAVA